MPQEPTEEVDASAFCRAGGRRRFALAPCGAALALTSDERSVPLLLRDSAGMPRARDNEALPAYMS